MQERCAGIGANVRPTLRLTMDVLLCRLSYEVEYKWPGICLQSVARLRRVKMFVSVCVYVSSKRYDVHVLVRMRSCALLIVAFNSVDYL